MSEYKPDWVIRLENWGEEQKKKHPQKEKKKPWEKKGEFFGEIVGDVITLIIINMAPVWFPGFFTSGYTALLAVANVVIVMQIIISVLLILYSPKWFYYLGKSGNNILGFVSVTTAIVLFPFNVPYGLGYLFRFGLTVAAIVTFIVSVVYLIKAIISVIANN